ncbi:N-acetylglucosamine-6-phosphate deacetylase [Vallitalea okinawensis]|uniref:N-acetylglucosamine-6-phosphate deacetylase n=1 Tax=Vallitalea okinawensis TaxID=2078660 RepID=UPI000CFB512E|nr:N-acetylglucosamine-6-phosphate deacetylase [Vallitalea okinawensis]
MKCIINGKIITNNNILLDQAICFTDKVCGIGELSVLEKKFGSLDIIDAKGSYVTPGFIDIHIHGIQGHDVCDGDIEGLSVISNAITKYGVTSYLPTTMTIPFDDIYHVLDQIKCAKESHNEGAEILGVHLEGPFINKERKGAQNEKYIIMPDYQLIEDYKELISLITIAPETEGAMDFIKKVSATTNIVLSLGHTNATFEEAMEGIENGITHSTHTFNAMSGLLHRKPGVVGAALLSDDVKCEVIADNIHMHPALYKLFIKTKGLDKIILVTDCVQAGGLPDGEYTLGGQKIFVEGNKSVLENGTIAGSVLKLNKAIHNFKESADVNIKDIIRFVTENPAKSLGVYDRKGSLEVDKDADIVLLDDNTEVMMTIGKGKILYEK